MVGRALEGSKLRLQRVASKGPLRTILAAEQAATAKCNPVAGLRARAEARR